MGEQNNSSNTIGLELRRNPAFLALTQEIADFYYREVDLLDERRFEAWLDLLAEDLVYFMPMRRNVRHGYHDEQENTIQGQGISWLDEDKWTLQKRVEQIRTGIHWAEEPLSRVCHMITNVQLLDVRPNIEAPSEVQVRSRFLIHQNRGEYETYTFVGKRTDTLRRVVTKEGDDWRIARREIILDQNVLLAKNLTVFF
jgi:3-phenylpropionate/cinnamic acid dioxygenase small subunit